MRIWLMTAGEPLPIDESGERLLRTGTLADMIAEFGHEVVWWTSAFNHMHKRFRSTNDQHIRVNSRYEIFLLHANGYSRNVSIRRILNHRRVATKFRRYAPTLRSPDVILCSLPILELCVEATRFGRERGIPVVLDVRDIWPDTIVGLASGPLRPFARLALSRAYQAAGTACRNATAIGGITDACIDWALQFASRERTPLDRAFPLGYRSRQPQEHELDAADQFWRSLGLASDDREFVVCFFGTIGSHFEIDTIVEAAHILEQSGRKVRFVLCGSGPGLESSRRQAASAPNVLLPGWINAAQIWSLMRLSAVGLAHYVGDAHRLLIPNKPIEYLSAGLPIISSLQGVLADLLQQEECGFTYRCGNGRQLAQCIATCYDNRNLRDRMSWNAERLFNSRFSAEKVYGEMMEHLLQVGSMRHLEPAVSAAA